MKFLTIRQPWASLIAVGAKTIETRPFSTQYRGPLAIHAGKAEPGPREPGRVARLGGWACWWAWSDGIWTLQPEPECNGGVAPLPLGAVVAVCDLVDVVPIHEWCCSCDHGVGIYALVARVARNEDIVGLFRSSDGAGVKHPDWSPSQLDYLDARHPRQQAPFGDFRCGRYAWLLENVRPVDPVPMKGAQGLRDVPEDVAAQLREVTE